MVFLDRVEIWNSGTLPGNLKVEDLRKPHSSHPSNPTLASVLFFGDYIQQVGSGTTEMIRQCKKHGLPEPEFISVRNLEFKTILARDVYTDTFFQKAGFNERQVRAIKLIKEKSIIALSDLQDVYKEVARKTLYRDLQGLVDKGILKAQGDRKGRKYSF
jgi:ATP-dependent DNA helicase RecG